MNRINNYLENYKALLDPPKQLFVQSYHRLLSAIWHFYNQCLFNSFRQVIWLECESKVSHGVCIDSFANEKCKYLASQGGQRKIQEPPLSNIWLHQVLSDALPGVTVPHPKRTKCDTATHCRVSLCRTQNGQNATQWCTARRHCARPQNGQNATQ